MKDFARSAEIYKAFCDENRLRIIYALKSGEKCACTLLEEVPVVQSTLSHHMGILVRSSIVSSRREGKWTYYSLSDDGAQEAKALLNQMLERTQDYMVCKSCSQ